jgi:hypothetical protein
MDAEELTGYYTYRSYLNRPEPVDDFNRLRFAEAELFLFVQPDGTVVGTLAFPAVPGTDEKAIMDVSGRVSTWSPVTLSFTGRGRPNTEIADFHYEYDGSIVRHWETGINQRLALAGTVLRAKDHASGADVARAGATASFIAVKRDFVEPRDVPGLALLPDAVTMLASRVHRLRHATWHTVRGAWWRFLDDNDRREITDCGWGFARPPFTPAGGLDLTNGAGEDFLFMHRRMIQMVREIYRQAGVAPIQGWQPIPGPGIPQFVYTEQDDPTTPGMKIWKFAADQSGFMVPAGEPSFADLFGPDFVFPKTAAYFRSVMGPLQRIFRSPRYLSSLTLGALGNLIEFTIHNPMHVRWSTLPRDPRTGAVAVRGDYDFDEKWDDLHYDFLGEFYSSHVNPLFWRLHGWVDDRIEDWYQAHEAASPGQIQRNEHQGVSWFKPGMWVQAADPFDWPDSSHDDHGRGDDHAIAVMLEVLEIIRKAEERATAPTALAADRRSVPSVGAMNFARWIEPTIVEQPQ